MRHMKTASVMPGSLTPTRPPLEQLARAHPRKQALPVQAEPACHGAICDDRSLTVAPPPPVRSPTLPHNEPACRSPMPLLALAKSGTTHTPLTPRHPHNIRMALLHDSCSTQQHRPHSSLSRPKADGTAYARYSARSASPGIACAAISSALGHTEATALSSTCVTAPLSERGGSFINNKLTWVPGSQQTLEEEKQMHGAYLQSCLGSVLGRAPGWPVQLQGGALGEVGTVTPQIFGARGAVQ